MTKFLQIQHFQAREVSGTCPFLLGEGITDGEDEGRLSKVPLELA